MWTKPERKYTYTKWPESRFLKSECIKYIAMTRAISQRSFRNCNSNIIARAGTLTRTWRYSLLVYNLVNQNEFEFAL